MARRNSRSKGPSIQPAEKSFLFSIATGTNTNYIDLAQCASYVNRRLYAQGHKYYVESVELISTGGGMLTLSTIPDTWVTVNAWVKAKALWKSMQNRVLDDNPSVAGKWRDFKVYLDTAHYDEQEGNNLIPECGDPVISTGTAISRGEWNMATMVLPQHDVTQATGVVKDADEFELHMIGNDKKSNDTFLSGGIIKMYADTRARQTSEPLVPTDMPDSWGTIITDDGSQDPELAAIVDAENDLPPYDNDDYVGGDTNWVKPVVQTAITVPAASVGAAQGYGGGFCAPLGLIKVETALGSAGVLKINLMPGITKGVMTTPMKQ